MSLVGGRRSRPCGPPRNSQLVHAGHHTDHHIVRAEHTIIVHRGAVRACQSPL